LTAWVKAVDKELPNLTRISLSSRVPPVSPQAFAKMATFTEAAVHSEA
jgi:hypothetical protein